MSAAAKSLSPAELPRQNAVVIVSASEHAKPAHVLKPKNLYDVFANSPFSRLENFDETISRRYVSVRDLRDFGGNE